MSRTEGLIEKLADTIARDGERWRDEYRAGMAQFSNGLRLTAARPRAISAGSVLMWGGPTRIVGWSVLASGGPVRLILHDGRDTSGDVVGVIDLVDQEDTSQWFGPGGITVGEALYVERTGAGAGIGAVYLGAVD